MQYSWPRLNVGGKSWSTRKCNKAHIKLQLTGLSIFINKYFYLVSTFRNKTLSWACARAVVDVVRLLLFKVTDEIRSGEAVA
jgi:hypothetical protein